MCRGATNGVLVFRVILVTQRAGEHLGPSLGALRVLGACLRPRIVCVFVRQLALLRSVMLNDTLERDLATLLSGLAAYGARESTRPRTRPEPATFFGECKRAVIARAERLGEAGELKRMLAHRCLP
jgi:hypothetical protein